jgi:hypothetical protein
LKDRRHHNNKGLHTIRCGAIRIQVAFMAHRLNPARFEKPRTRKGLKQFFIERRKI